MPATYVPGNRAGRALIVSGLVYALCRGYYGVGGTIGTTSWRAVDLGAAVVLLLVAILPLAALPLWRRPAGRRALLAVAWLLAAGGVVHALLTDTRRVLGLVGAHHLRYLAPGWLTHDAHRAGLHDLLLDATWLLVAGSLWAVLAWLVLEWRSPAA